MFSRRNHRPKLVLRVQGEQPKSARRERAAHVDDPELKTELLKGALAMGNPGAIPLLIRVISDGGVFADDAYDALRAHVRLAPGKDRPGKLSGWWNEVRTRLQWDRKSGMFTVKGWSPRSPVKPNDLMAPGTFCPVFC